MRKLIYLLLISFQATASVSEADFNIIPDRVLESMSKEIEDSGLTILIDKNWQSETQNAGANRKGNTGTIKVYGGYARIKEMTNESFAQTVCHELGHLISNGIKVMPTHKYASESEADYFSSKTCLRKYFSLYPVNREATDWQKDKCIENSSEKLSLCTDLLIASRDSLRVQLAKSPPQVSEDYTYLDKSVTTRTLYNDYASTRCRYTSYVHGALELPRPSCWHNESSLTTDESYISDYEYNEAQFVSSIKNLTHTHFGCSFELESISYFRESALSPLSMRKVLGKIIYLYGQCVIKEEKNISGVITLFQNKLFYNLESKDK